MNERVLFIEYDKKEKREIMRKRCQIMSKTEWKLKNK